jgi:similar to stage IV sporulation protein
MAFAVSSVFIWFFLFSKLIWRIDVISPDRQLNQNIYNLLYAGEVYAGSVFSQEKNQNIIQQIFTDVEDVGYVTLNFYKGILTCKVDPKIEKADYMQDLKTGNITAAQDGVIKDLRIYSGFSDVKPGQTVTKGQVLVSATYIDRNGNLQQVKPRAYIKAYCVKKYTAQIELNKTVLLRTGEYETEKIIKFSGKDIKIGRCDISDYTNYDCEKKYSYVDVLGFRLPFTVEKSRYYKKEQVNIQKDKETAAKAAETVIDTLVESDTSLEAVLSKEYDYSLSEDLFTVSCTVYGEYNIAE